MIKVDNFDKTETQTAIDLLRKLIQIPSQNGYENEYKVIKFIANLLDEINVSYKIIEIEGRENLIATIPFGNNGPKIILNGHLDTQPAVINLDEWEHPPFSGEIINNKIYGRGSCDMKAGVAAYLIVAKKLIQNKEDLSGTLELQFVADEEMGSNFGMKNIDKYYGLNGDLAIVAEPTQNKCCHAQLGNIWLIISLKTKESHAGYAWKASNAINHINCLLANIENEVNQHRIMNPDKTFPYHPTLNVGKIEGGFHAGTVPGECEAIIDIRVRPGESQEFYVSLVNEVVKNYELLNSDIKVEINNYKTGGFPSAYLTKTDNKFYKKIIEKTNDEEGFFGFFGGSDAYYLSKNNIPTVVFGPGDLENAHMPNEYVNLDEYLKYIEMLYSFLEEVFRE
ncbi:M20 family metallopeptidase [Caldifermentibacillus hisashii]|uniref:M20 family metallopeptidase n=1 Tax=Caldifermentibacillus hisashii TaxID=996558 RepID=A0ABU9JUC9_9BACI